MSARPKRDGQRRTRLAFLFVGILAAAAIIAVAAFLLWTPEPERTVDPESAARQAQFEAASLEYDRSIQSSMQHIAIGETATLSNDAAISVPWDGSMEVTLENATLYTTTLEAAETFDIGNVFIDDVTAREWYGDDCQLLVLQVKVTNIDAISTTGDYFAVDPFTPYYPFWNGDTEEIPWTSYAPCELATFNGTPQGVSASSRDVNNFDLAAGETKEMVLGYWVPGSSYVMGCSDISTLVLRPSLNANEPGIFIFELGL